MRVLNLLCAAMVLSVLLCSAANAVDVKLSSSLGEAFPVGATVMFLADATNTNSVTTYMWDFDDGSPTVTTSVPMIDHVYTSANNYSVTVFVNNGVDAIGGDFGFFEAFDPPLPTDPLSINMGDPADTNPDDGFTFTLKKAQAGFVDASLSLDAAHTGVADGFTTDFGDGVNGRNGPILLHRYADSGIFILESDHDRGGSPFGKLRKTLIFSDVEILGVNSDPLVGDLPPQNRKLKFKSLKGKFNFKANAVPLTASRAASVNDSVTVSWTMTLPAGFDINTQVADVAIGNVTDSVPLKSNGFGDITQPSPFKSVRFRFPRLKKGVTRSAASVSSQVSVQMSSQDLPSQGFDTEGITTRQFVATGVKGPFGRTIQVAAMFAGVSYSGLATVSLNITSSGDFGVISGRAKKN
jgi:hypothetical protein